MTRALFVLDLENDSELISAYEARHLPGAVWPEVIRAIHQLGYRDMEIWRAADRLVMLADIAPAGLAPLDPDLQPIVAQWEAEMRAYQRPIAPDGPKWLPMTRIFALDEHPAP
ncbi:MAG: L-rhamnose mutarotase [Sphingomonas sp.]|uniref:L-rhamnose mutarotase n=1 Tax=Sphingomonas sp. TaxID=28214 RepID=UPI0025F1E2FD|nr:L-rhamnose mutarotase [Sphingomonas sp.]MBQ1498970.1 L-rhamnose mutarotase [Sphingomonas sp.]